MVAFVPWIVAVVGALGYVLASKGEVKEMGRLGFFVGLFFGVWGLAGHAIRVLP
jgi:hypothetical protein